MKRRDFLRSTSIVCASLALPNAGRLFAERSPSDSWRTFEVTTRVEVLKPSGVTRVWLPAALTRNTPFQRTFSNKFSAEGGTAEMVESKADATRNRRGDFSRRRETGPDPHQPDRDQELCGRSLRPATAPKGGPRRVGTFPAVDQAHADRRHRESDGHGDHQRRKNGCREGARDLRVDRRQHVSGIQKRVAAASVTSASCWSPGIWAASAPISTRSTLASRAPRAFQRATCTASASPSRNWDTRASAPRSENVTKAQHCRAEVYLGGYGWVPVDPADVRKVVLEEPPGNRPLDDDMVTKARARLFGSWEMNWMAYNFAHDVALPGSSGAPVGFLMYPQAETADGRLD